MAPGSAVAAGVRTPRARRPAQADVRGQQRDVREDGCGRRPAMAARAGRVGVVPAVRGEGVGEPGAEGGREVRPGFVALAGRGLLQRAQLAQLGFRAVV